MRDGIRSTTEPRSSTSRILLQRHVTYGIRPQQRLATQGPARESHQNFLETIIGLHLSHDEPV